MPTLFRAESIWSTAEKNFATSFLADVVRDPETQTALYHRAEEDDFALESSAKARRRRPEVRPTTGWPPITNLSAGDQQTDYTTAPHDPDSFHKVLLVTLRGKN